MKPESHPAAQEAIHSAKMGALLDNLTRNFSQIMQEAEVMARIRRAHYDASIKAGFTPEQALVLCMKPSLT